MPRYKNISNAPYTNTKYNIFNIQPGEEFEIDKVIISPFLQKVSDYPPKYDGDTSITLPPGVQFEIDVSEFTEISIYPIYMPDNNYADICINASCSELPETQKVKLIPNLYYNEKYLRYKGIYRIYVRAYPTNTSSIELKFVYKYK